MTSAALVQQAARAGLVGTLAGGRRGTSRSDRGLAERRPPAAGGIRYAPNSHKRRLRAADADKLLLQMMQERRQRMAVPGRHRIGPPEDVDHGPTIIGSGLNATRCGVCGEVDENKLLPFAVMATRLFLGTICCECAHNECGTPAKVSWRVIRTLTARMRTPHGMRDGDWFGDNSPELDEEDLGGGDEV